MLANVLFYVIYFKTHLTEYSKNDEVEKHKAFIKESSYLGYSLADQEGWCAPRRSQPKFSKFCFKILFSKIVCLFFVFHDIFRRFRLFFEKQIF